MSDVVRAAVITEHGTRGVVVLKGDGSWTLESVEKTHSSFADALASLANTGGSYPAGGTQTITTDHGGSE